MESDEAAGVFVLQKTWPDLIVVCGSLASRELPGYGYTGKIKAASPKETMTDGALDIQFIDYRAEVHRQNGVLCLEKNSGNYDKFRLKCFLTGTCCLELDVPLRYIMFRRKALDKLKHWKEMLIWKSSLIKRRRYLEGYTVVLVK
jgi:hypothetical protein